MLSGNDPATPPGGSAPLPPESPLGASAPRRSWLGTVARLWCLKGVDSVPRGSPFAVILVLGLAWVTAWAYIDRWQRQPDPEFVLDGIALFPWYAMGALGLAGLLRSGARPRPAFGACLLLALGAVPLPLLLASVLFYTVDAQWFRVACGVAAVHGIVFLHRGLKAVTGTDRRYSALLGVAFIAAFMWASNAVNAVPDIWSPRESDTDSPVSEDTLVDRETALFEQAARIDSALGSIHRQPGPAAQAFFLGFAGVGDQKVFAQEIGLAARVIGERYRVEDRHLSLINDERDLERAPLASVSGLGYALKGLAELMDPDQDVLFLAISSHGSEEPSIAVANSRFPLTSLTSDDLREALHESGIRWRVILISACYAGGFIDDLRDTHTIVITAAAKDRTSFGCSNDAELTYFGEAFYRDALPEAKSLRAAFDSARHAIAVREHDEHEEPSNPQAFFGAEMERKLTSLEH